jgi:Putative  PD-(D/E)XK family member, (DUF4420)
MMRIEQIWNELENDISSSSGYLLRRYSGVVQPDVFVALKVPEKIRCITASVTNTVEIDISAFSNLRDIQAEVIPDPQNLGRNILLFKLLNSVHADVFSILCEDLMLNIGNPADQKELVKSLLDRFFKWESLFEKVKTPGLTHEEQHGLFAELYLLRKLLFSQISSPAHIVRIWVGPDKQIKDFQAGSIAIEVKCTTGNNHQRIQINGERQLDASNLERLFLFHLSAEIRLDNGESLIDLVNSIQTLLTSDTITLSQFRSKLLEVGYFEYHAGLYSQTGYVIRNESYYSVSYNFPRIEERDLRPGIGDVKYSIITSQCYDFMLAESEVFNELRF